MKRLYILLVICLLLTACKSNDPVKTVPVISVKPTGNSFTPEATVTPAPTIIPTIIPTPQLTNSTVIPALAKGAEALAKNPVQNNKSVSKTVYYCGPRSSLQVALTFDDGPDIRFTAQILDILKKEDIKATFFVIGEMAKSYPDMVKRIVSEGHVIGNHTWDHGNLPKQTYSRVFDELDKTDKVLYDILGYHPSLFRPPYGATNPGVISQITSMGYSIVDWSVDTRDWAGTPVNQIMSYVRKQIYPGGIILQHCSGGTNNDLSNTVKALPEIISFLKAKKYTFTTIPELLNIEPVRNP